METTESNGSDELSQELSALMQLEPKKEYKKRPITDPNLSSDTRRRRVKEMRAEFEKWCQTLGCSTVQLCGLFIHLDSYTEQRATSRIGWSLFTGASVEPQSVSVVRALWIMERLGLSKAKYTELRLHLSDLIHLPAEYLVLKETRKMRPELSIYRHGVRASLSECLSLTLIDHLTVAEKCQDLGPNICFSYVYGQDGSGCHQDYALMSKTTYSTKQIFSVCFALLSITKPDGSVIWSAAARGHNSPTNDRPLALFPEKECDELLREFNPTLDIEVKNVRSGLTLTLPSGRIINARVLRDAMTMLDGKMIVRLLQLGGAYCTMCTRSLPDCHDPAIIAEGFEIDRSVESIKELALVHVDPDTGCILTAPRDYDTRQGITGIPITEADVTKTLPVCHMKIQTFDFIVNRLMVKQNSTQKWHCSAKPVRYSAAERESEERAWNRLKIDIKDALGIKIKDPNDMIKGNSFKTFSSDVAREKLSEMIEDESIRHDFKFIHLHLCAVVRVINSQHRTIDMTRFREVGTMAYLMMVEVFPWAVISPTLHRIMGHAWQRIEANECKGLGSESEEVLEGTNKLLRYHREHGARKTSTEENFTDVFNHCWQGSSPLLTELDREKRHRAKKMLIQNEIDSLVESMFCVEEVEETVN
jgi:hypothetical protein